MKSFNTRLLVIDDEAPIRESFVKILGKSTHEAPLLEAESALFDDAPIPPANGSLTLPEFLVDTACSGKDGCDKVRQSLGEGRPYAAVFCDMRMPGMDGLATSERIRELDERVEIIFVTAYSDHSIESIVQRAGTNVSYFCKPFSPVEIRQLATKAIYEWNRSREYERLLHNLSELREKRTEKPDVFFSTLCGHLCEQLDVTDAVLATAMGPGKETIIHCARGAYEDPKAAADLIAKCAEGESKESAGTRFYHRSGDLIFHAVSRDTSNVISAVKRHMARLFLAQAQEVLENMELHRQIVEKEKLASVGTVVSMVAHDLRAPIAAISSAVTYGQMKPDPAHKEKAFQMVEQCADLALNLVTDIQDFTRNAPLEKEAIHFGKIEETLWTLLGHLFKEKDILFEMKVEPGLSLLADSRKLTRILFNLIKNAIEAFPKEPSLRPEITVSAASREGTVVLSVKDNGPGIPESLHETLFDPFVTRNKPSCTGLGLAIAHEFMIRHEGSVEFTTGEQGTTFILHFPSV